MRLKTLLLMLLLLFGLSPAIAVKEAYDLVKGNKGSPGLDGETFE